MNHLFKRTTFLKAILLFIFFFVNHQEVIRAEDVDSSNFSIHDFTLGAGGGEDQTSSNFKVLQSFGDGLQDERLTSTNYKVGYGTPTVWMANVPNVQCFETTTDGSTNCDDGDVNPDGMVMVCGKGGCYDRARIEIDPQNNPSDTLYSVQITTDAAWNSWNYIDGSTYLIEAEANHDINDYLTESTWEGTGTNINILGLESDTQYYVRITALHGDYTESSPSPDANATTTHPQITFDLDIAGTGGGSSETSAPYSISIGEMAIDTVSAASALIWLDIGSNASSGVVITVKDANNGLYEPTETYTISSATADLDVASEGYGLQEYSASESYLGPLTVESNFGGAGNNVGGISTSTTNIYNTASNPIHEGRASLYVKVKPSIQAPAPGSYEDEITLIAVGTY